MADPLKLAIFDCDGTLVDSQHHIHAAMADAFAAGGLQSPGIAEVRNVIGLPLDEAIRRLLPEEGRDPAAVRLLDQAYRDSFLARRQKPDYQEPLFQGCRQALEALLEDGWLLAVATGKARRGLLATLDHHGLRDHFVSLKTADDAPGKPHPGMIEMALAETGVARGDAVMIGDTVYDIEMARNARVTGIGVSWGYHHPEDLTRAGASRIVDTYEALHSHLLAG